jgi:hypothetical protein
MVNNSKSINFDQIQSDLDENEEALKDAKSNSSSDDHIEKILKTKAKLRTRKASPIKFSDPILYQNENPVFFPNTINVIQGQAGVHKSRLAETICSSLIKRAECTNSLLGFYTSEYSAKYSILYVDTERNLNEQLPFALQSLQMKAGYQREEHPAEFDYISLLEFDRKERFSVLNKYLSHYRAIYKDRPTFIVLDVSTDCIEDFNKSDKSMELIDHMNLAINEHNVIFLCLIHENPGSEKARGHFGTELINKSSTVVRVDFERDSNGPTDIIQVKYLKCRSTARHEPFYIKYSEEEKGLVLVDSESVDAIKTNRQQTAKISDVIEYFSVNFKSDTEITKTELLESLSRYTGGSTRTIETRLAEIIKKEIQFILTSDDEPYQLEKSTKKKLIYYSVKHLK